MSSKPKLSTRDTFILDNDMIDELDELSLTSVIRDFETSPEAKSVDKSTDAGSDDSDAGDADAFELTLLDD